MPHNLFMLAAITPADPNRIIVPAGLIMAIVSIVRRKEAFGSWLLYFYHWICAFLIGLPADAVGNPAVYFSSTLKPAIHLALIMATVPRLMSTAVLVTVAFILVQKREWTWGERVRSRLITTTVCAGISVAIDYYYFPQSLYANAIKLVGALI